MSISGRLMIGNVYGQRAYDQMASWRPAELAEIPDPQAYFRRLGLDVEAEIVRRTRQLAGQPPAGESYLARVGRLGRARFEAEGRVLAERVLVGPSRGIRGTTRRTTRVWRRRGFRRTGRGCRWRG